MVKRAGRNLIRLVRWGAGVVTIVLVVVTVAGTLLAVRLSQGPIDVAWVVRAALARSGAASVTIGEASLHWTGFHNGTGSPISLVLRDLQVNGADGNPRLTATEGAASISAAGLLAGEVLPRTAELRGAHLRASRDSDGHWQLDLGDAQPGDTQPDAHSGDAQPSGAVVDGDDASGTRAELRRPVSSDHDLGSGHVLRQLRRLSLHDATIDVRDAQLGALRLSNVQVDLTRKAAGGIEGQAELDATLGETTAHVSAHASLETGGGSRIDIATSAIDPAVLATTSPALAPAAPFDAAVTVSATIELDASDSPILATLHAAAAAGRARLPETEVAFDSLDVRGELDWVGGEPSRIRDVRIDAVLPSPSGAWPTTISLTASGERAAATLQGQVEIALDHVALADLDRLWPRGVAIHAREWITGNIAGGVARSLHLVLGVEGPSDLSDLHLVRASGGMTGEDVTVSWLKPIPPVEHLNVQIALLDPDALDITVDPATGPARQGRLTLPGGTVRITGLAGLHQFAQINVDMAGTVAETLALLRHPRMKLLSKHPIPVQSSAGTMAGKLGVRVPLEGNVDFDQIAITASVRMIDLSLGGIVAGRDLSRGSVQLDATNDGLKAQGRATIAGLPGRIGVTMDFRAGGPDEVLQSATFDGRPDTAQMAAAGLAIPGGLTGTPALSVTYTAHRSGAAEVTASADLAAAGVSLLGWRKPVGQAASARARLLLDHDRLAGIDMLHAEGPGLAVDGRTEMADGRPVALVIERGQLGRSRASGTIRFGSPLRVTMDGPTLDASGLLKNLGGSPEPGSTPGPAYVVDAHFAELILGPGRTMTGVAVHADNDGRRLRQATLEASGLSAAVTPAGAGRTLHVQAADGGAMLRVLDVTDSVQGGRLVIDARYDDQSPGSPLAGTLQLDGFHVRQAPMIGKVLQALTLYGLVDALRGPGLVFERLVMPFRYAGDTLELTDARAFSASLGVTTQGRIDLARHTADLRGTVVPAYAINTALGRLPIIGRVFSPEESGGLVAARYTLRGSLDNPDVSVNPLSALTPGILRKLFDVFD